MKKEMKKEMKIKKMADKIHAMTNNQIRSQLVWDYKFDSERVGNMTRDALISALIHALIWG